MATRPERLTLYVCDSGDGGPRMHLCRRVQGSRDELEAATGSRELPAIKLSDGTVITNSRAILAWIKQRG